MSDQIPVKLYDPEKQSLYTIYLDKTDARRCKTDLDFAEQLLAEVTSVKTEKDQVETEASSMTDTEIEATDVKSHVGENDEKLGWSYNETLALLSAYENHKEDFQFARKSKFVWQDIANELLSNGFERSAAKCEMKWRNLMRTYKHVKDLKRRTGRGAIKFKFFTQIDDILGDDSAINCSHTFSTTVTSAIGQCKLAGLTNEEQTQLLDSNDHDYESSNTSNIEINTSNPSERKSSDVASKKGTIRKRARNEMLMKKNEELSNIKINYFKKKQVETEASSMIDTEIEATDVESHVGENDEKLGWSYNETLALIAAYENLKKKFQIVKKRKFVWQDIANQLLSNGFKRSAAKCELKWRNLMRTYKHVKDSKRRTGRGAIKFKFFTQIDDILRDKPANICSHTFSTTVTSEIEQCKLAGLTNEEQTQLSDSNDHDSNTEINTSNQSEMKSSDVASKKETKRKRTCEEMLMRKNEELIDIKINYFKKKQEEREARDVKRDRKLEIREKMLELEQKKVELLEKYLENVSKT